MGESLGMVIGAEEGSPGSSGSPEEPSDLSRETRESFLKKGAWELKPKG